jgi:hypothetical protein
MNRPQYRDFIVSFRGWCIRKANRRKPPQTTGLAPHVAVNPFVLVTVSADHRQYPAVLRFVVRSGTFGRFFGLFGE